MNRVDNNFILQKTKINKPQPTQNNIENRINNNSFQDVLSKINESNETVKFSKHALARLNQRNIVLTENEMKMLCTSLYLLKVPS